MCRKYKNARARPERLRRSHDLVTIIVGCILIFAMIFASGLIGLFVQHRLPEEQKSESARVVTAAMEGMSFLEPVRVGDTVSCYARVEKIGRTSMTIPVEVWVTRHMTGEERRVTHGVFTVVAVDESGKPIPVKRGSA